MSIYTSLTKKYLLRNKKRTTITLVGMILSIALITSIGTFLISFQHYNIEKTKNDYGSYHLKIKHVNHQLLNRLQANPQIKKVGVLSKETYFLNDGRKFELKTIDQASYSLLPFQTVQKQRQSGMIIEKWVSADLKKKDKIENPIILKDIEGQKLYLQVHKIVENNENLREQQGLQAFIVQKSVHDQRNFDIYVEVDQRANFQDVYKQISNDVPKENIELNHPLISIIFSKENYRGAKALYSKIYIFPIGIVVIATIAFIFNTFQISITERIREIGLLRTVGATKRQIQKLIIYEMGIYGVISVPLGIILGICGFWVILSIYQLVFEETEFSLFYFPIILSPYVLILSVLIGLFSLIISGLIPLKITNRATPLDVIRGKGRRRIFKVKRINRFLKNIVSIETVMAIRNILRNRLRSFVIIFSLAFSTFLFISFSSLLMLLIQSDMENQSEGEFSIRFQESKTLPESLWRDLESIPDLKEKYIHYDSFSTEVYIPSSNIRQSDMYVTNIDGKGFYSRFTRISPLTEENESFLLKRLLAGSLNKKEMLYDKGVIYVKSKVSKNLFHVGDKIYVENNNGAMQKVKISGIVDLDQFENQLLAYPEIIPSIGKPTVNKISLYLKSQKDMKQVSQKLDEITAYNPNLEIINELEVQRNQSSLKMQFQILLYGFVAVIAFIGVLNIINTTIMNIILRKKEYATLQAIGMSRKSIRSMVIREGVFYGLISGMIGIGATGLIDLFLIINEAKSGWMDSIKIYLAAFVVLLMICYISAKISSSMLKDEQWMNKLRDEEGRL